MRYKRFVLVLESNGGGCGGTRGIVVVELLLVHYITDKLKLKQKRISCQD